MSEKWWDMSDDELDDLFREASDKAEIPFDSSALDKLRQKIDFKPMPQPAPPQGLKKQWIALAGLLIFVGVALLYTFSGKKEVSKLGNNSNRISENTLPSSTNNEKLNLNKPVESKQANITHQEIEHEKELKELGNLPNNQKSEVFVDKNIFSKAKTSNGSSTNANVIESNIAHHKTSTTIGNSKSKIRNGQTNEKGTKLDFPLDKTLSNFKKSKSISEDNLLKNNTLNISSTKAIDEKTPTTSVELNGSNSTFIKQEKNTNEVNSSIISYSSKTNRKKSRLANSKFNSNQVYSPSVYQEANVPILTSLNIPENKPVEEETILRTNFYNVDFLTNKETKSLQIKVDSESLTYVDASPIVMKQPKFSRFGIRLAIAPEINSIERMETSAVVGGMFAFLLEYHLTKKLTLQTGVNYSKKKYTGDFEYYRAWTNGIGTKPLTVDGICSVVDIPINLRLNAFQVNHNTFFISGGVSSYLISDEIYTYNYAWGPPKVRDWTGNSSSFYWNTLNLSVGVEHKMNKHFTFQVEPFLKTPLLGVGRGLVNLYSSGLLFSTKYEF